MIHDKKAPYLNCNRNEEQRIHIGYLFFFAFEKGAIFKTKMKVAVFRRNMQECGIRYALLWYLDLPYSFDSSHSYRLRKLSDWAYDWCNQRYQKCLVPVGQRLHEPEFTEYLPTACTMHPADTAAHQNLEVTL